MDNEFVGAAVMISAGLGFLAVVLFGDPLPMWLRALLGGVALVAAFVGLVIWAGDSGGSGGSGGNIGDGGYGPGGGGL